MDLAKKYIKTIEKNDYKFKVIIYHKNGKPWLDIYQILRDKKHFLDFTYKKLIYHDWHVLLGGLGVQAETIIDDHIEKLHDLDLSEKKLEAWADEIK